MVSGLRLDQHQSLHVNGIPVAGTGVREARSRELDPCPHLELLVRFGRVEHIVQLHLEDPTPEKIGVVSRSDGERTHGVPVVPRTGNIPGLDRMRYWRT